MSGGLRGVRGAALAALLLGAEVLFLYARTLPAPITRNAEFLMDMDEWRTIRQVKQAAEEHASWTSRLAFLREHGAVSPDRPLAGWSHYLSGFLLGFDPVPLNAVNAAMHGAAAFFLFLFVRALSGSFLAGLSAAAGFAAYAHPEAAVNRWIVRDAPQAAMFLAASLALAAAPGGRAARVLAYAGSLGAYLLTLGSYPVAGLMGTLAPAAFAARRGGRLDARTLRRAFLLGLPFWIAFGAQALRVAGSANYAAVSAAMRPDAERILRFILREMPRFLFAGPLGARAALGVAVLGAAAALLRKDRNLPALGLAAGLTLLAATPVAGFYGHPEIVWHGKYTYLPAFGLAALLGLLLFDGRPRAGAAQLLALAGAALWLGDWGAACLRENVRWAERGARLEAWTRTASEAAAKLPRGGTVYAVPAMGDAPQLFRQRIGTFERPDLRWALVDLDLAARFFSENLKEDAPESGAAPPFSLAEFAARRDATLLYFLQPKASWFALRPEDAGAWLRAREAEARTDPAPPIRWFAPGTAADADWTSDGAAGAAPYSWRAASGRRDLYLANPALRIDPGRYDALSFEARVPGPGDPVRIVLSWTSGPPGVAVPADGFAQADLPRGEAARRIELGLGNLPTWSFLGEARGIDLRIKGLGDAEFALRDLTLRPRAAHRFD